MSAVMNAIDPDSSLHSFAAAARPKGKLIPLVRDFYVEDPVSRLGNNPILMLYGRNRQNNQGYVNADYYNDNDSGEYYRNRPQGGKLKTLMPMSGTMTFQAGCSFPGENVLHRPENGNMILSQMKIGDTRVATQYADLGVEKAYEILSKCFKTDTSGIYPKVIFNIMDKGSVDWHSDMVGVGNWKDSTLTYLLCGGFELDILDPHGIPCRVQLSITSREAGKMSGRKYYVSNGCQVFVPPIEVHWGCFAPETRVRLAGEGELWQRMDLLRPGDRLVTALGTAATVADMAVGEEDYILRVTASWGSIRLTAGHPVMLADGSVKGAGRLEPGDLLKTPSGSARVLEVRQEAYRGRVYNPVLEESGREGMYILAEGFFCGDYHAQNRPAARKETLLTEQQPEMRDQFRSLCRH